MAPSCCRRIGAHGPPSGEEILIASQTTTSGFPQSVPPAQVAEIEPRARAIYRELRDGGFSDTDIMAFAGELLSLVAMDVRSASAAE
jgi:hypothetical protein